MAWSACAHRASPEVLEARIQQMLDSGDSGEALKLAENSLRSVSLDRNPRGYWGLYLSKAEALLKNSGANASLKLLDSATIPNSREFLALQARKEFDQAKARFRLPDYEGAEALLAHASTLAESAQATALRAAIESWSAVVSSLREDFATAEQAARESDRLASASGGNWLKAQALGTFGFVRMSQLRYEEALHYFDQQLPLLESEDRASRAGAMNNMAVCHYKLGELDDALSYYKQALQINIATGHVDEQSVCLGNMGNVYLDRGEYADAKKCFLDAIHSDRGNQETLAKFFSNSARAAIQLKEWSAAEEYNEKALAIKRKLKNETAELYSLRNAAFIAQGKGDSAKAEALFSQVIQARSEDPTPALESQAGLAKLYAATNRPEQAEARFRAALRMIERSRARLVNEEIKLSFLASLISFYQDYVEFLMSHGQQERALVTAEASRARILRERLGVDQTTVQFSGAQYRRLAASTGAVLISYWTAPERSYVWVITGKDITAFTLPPQAEIKSLVERYGALIENLTDPLEIEDSTAGDLYRAVIAPIRDRIPNQGRVIFVPDGPLYALNPETLPAAQTAKHYLVEEATISITPALNLMAARTERRAVATVQPKSLLLIGDPEPGDDKFTKLPYAGQEIAAVERHFSPSHTGEFRSRRAVPGAYRKAAAQPFSYIHFTAHAIADSRHPLSSAIILAGPPNTCKLTARSVLEQPLHAGLVTLSACRTAGARTYAGEGMVGFTWAFFHAGARNVIAGLWDVSDESTPRLMDELYAGITAGKDPAMALRAAKLVLLRSKTIYSLPYYWAPFQLYVRTALQ